MAPTVAIAANGAWGIVNYRSGLVKALQAAGYQVAVIAPAGPMVGALRDLGVDFYPIAMSPRGRSPAADLRTFVEYIAILRRARPAAFLGFTAKPNIYGSIAARLCGVPVINNISGLGSVFSQQDWLTRLVSRLYRLSLKGAATVFFQNREDQALFERLGIVSKGRSLLLPGSGVDTAHFAPPAVAAPEPFIFLLAARLLWQKGIGEFVEAARRIRAKRPDVGFRILGIVEAPSAEAVNVEQLRQWEQEGVVEYLGSAEDVRVAYAAAHCVVLPSYYREGVPRVLLEASSMALPVITTDMPGCRDAIDDGVTGLMCEAHSVESLAKAMESMLNLAPGERQAMGAAGRAKMEREFREELVHRAYLNALEKLGPSRS